MLINYHLFLVRIQTIDHQRMFNILDQQLTFINVLHLIAQVNRLQSIFSYSIVNTVIWRHFVSSLNLPLFIQCLIKKLFTAGISKFSGGSVHHFPLFNNSKQQQVTEFQRVLTRYLTRKIGFESVMRVRCTRGLSIHTFHGNFFVRSTDLLSLPNVNPDSGFGMQITYEESLADVKTVCFQAALLYTSSKAERRIRVHTICLPVTDSLSDVMHSADQQCIVGLLSKMAVDRSLSSNLSDARDAFINATVDVFSAYKMAQNLPSGTSGLVAPQNLALFPLYILALLKQVTIESSTVCI